MAGRPKTRAAMAKLAEMGAERVFELIAQGGTVKRIAQELQVSEATVHGFVKAPERAADYARARARRAELLADEALEIADAARPEDAQVAKLRVDARKWFASKLDRTTFGDDRGPLVSVNLADMHIGALRRAPITVGNDTSDNER